MYQYFVDLILKEELEDINEMRFKRNIVNSAERFYQHNNESGYYFIIDIHRDTIRLCLTCDLQKTTPENIIDHLLLEQHLEIVEVKINETTLQNLIYHSQDTIFFTDAPMLSKLNLSKLSRSKEVLFDELLITSKIQQTAYEKLEHNLLPKEIQEEYYRMIKIKNDSFYQPPVQYLFKNDNEDVESILEEVKHLVAFLKQQQKVKSINVGYLNFYKSSTNWKNSSFSFEHLFKKYDSASLIFDFSAFHSLALKDPYFRDFLKLLIRYRSKIHYFFILDENDTQNHYLLEQLNPFTILRFHSLYLDEEHVYLWVTNYLKKEDIEYRELDFTKLIPKNVTNYELEDVLFNIKNEYYNSKTRYKTYDFLIEEKKSLVDLVKQVDKQAYEELQELIGLHPLKQLVDKMIAYATFKKDLQEKGIQTDLNSAHMIFTGNPGTAKTSVARLIAKIYKEKGILEVGHLVEVGRNELIGQYVGHTAPKIKALFEKAKGGILFIDEAYSLVEQNGYGKEAIDTIVQEMENLREEVIVIFAGYPKEMEDFLATNPGLNSRITFHVDFPNYSSSELLEITQLMIEKNGFHIQESALPALQHKIEELMISEGNTFGNGRTMRNLVQEMALEYAVRTIDSDEQTLELTKEDIRFIEKSSARKHNAIGFIA